MITKPLRHKIKTNTADYVQIRMAELTISTYLIPTQYSNKNNMYGSGTVCHAMSRHVIAISHAYYHPHRQPIPFNQSIPLNRCFLPSPPTPLRSNQSAHSVHRPCQFQAASSIGLLSPFGSQRSLSIPAQVLPPVSLPRNVLASQSASEQAGPLLGLWYG